MSQAPESKEAVESAHTMHAAPFRNVVPNTEPLFTSDARAVVDALIKQVKRVEQAQKLRLEQIPGANADLGGAIKAMGGVCKMLESLLGPREHRLKTDPAPFGSVRDGSKRYEVRRFDRDFHVGDILILVEFDRETARYSGESVRAKVTTITEPGAYGLPADVGVLGIEVLA